MFFTRLISAAIFVLLFCTISNAQKSHIREVVPFNDNWKFISEFQSTEINRITQPDFNDNYWQEVSLPHSAYIEPLVVINQQQGISCYRKSFKVEKDWANKKVFIRFGGAMNTADVWINGKHLLKHTGGYLPFTVDATSELTFGALNNITVEVDNRDNLQIPPGKPINTLDFCYYSGIYRNVDLIITDKVHITDAVYADQVAAGGIFITFPSVSPEKAKLKIKSSVKNESGKSGRIQVRYTLKDRNGNEICSVDLKPVVVKSGNTISVEGNLEIADPNLWSPDSPYLYDIVATVSFNGRKVDEITEKTGIRKFEIRNNQFFINDKQVFLYGTNRHQEYPYIGNALTDNAQYRDAVKIREAGFNIVRLSHYPQSEAFMNACDELGLLTIDCIPGWQFIGDSVFIEHCYTDARQLIRRDRNHACVAMWELSLNETEMPDSFMQEMNQIADEESPDQPIITCGWINKYYDVFTPARQHAKAPDYWKKHNDPRPFFTAEYGDWEYYAQNAGFNQTEFSDLKSEERTSRQLRAFGEKRLLQQALNYQEAHNDNLKSVNIGDANWLMFDYNRGYSPDIESSGIMDIFRIPKLSFWFFQSQRKPDFKTELFNSGPMVKIASLNNEDSDSIIRVYSNCAEVELIVGGKTLGKMKAQSDKYSDALLHPVFIFNKPHDLKGDMNALAYINNSVAASDQVAYTSEPSALKLQIDESGKKAGLNDVVFVYATVCDKKGQAISLADTKIVFTVEGDATLIGENPVNAEAGIATILLRTGIKGGKVKIQASSESLGSAQIELIPVKQ